MKALIFIVIVCLSLLSVDIYWHGLEFQNWKNMPGIFALAGFIFTFLAAFLAYLWQKLMLRDDTYYRDNHNADD